MDNENIPTNPTPEAPAEPVTPAETPVETPAEAPVETPVEPIVEAPVEATVEAPVAEPVAPAEPTPTEPAPVEAPAATPAAAAAPAAKSNKAAIIVLCSILGVAIIATAVTLLIVNNNKNNNTQGSTDTETSNVERNDDDDRDYNDEDDYDYNYDDDDEDEDDNNESKKSTKTLSSCSSAEECINKLDIDEGITVEQYNAAIGFDGVVDKDAYQSSYTTTYSWTFDNGDKLTAEFSSYGDIEIEVDYDYSAHTSNVDLDGYDTVRDKIEDGITYEELKAAFGGVDGLLSAKNEYSTKRLWVGSTSKKYIEARIDDDGMVTSVTGMK